VILLPEILPKTIVDEREREREIVIVICGYVAL